MDQTQITFVIVGMAVVTCLPRVLPLALLASRRLPEPLTRWLSYVPAAVLASLLGPALFAPEGRIEVGLGNLFLWAAPITAFIAWKTRGLFAPVAVGMALVALARLAG